MPFVKREMPMRFRIEEALVGIPGMTEIVRVAQGQRKKILGVLEQRRRAVSPANIGNFAEKVYSQYGEDGCIREIFRRIGVTNRYFVEFGIQDGTENSTRALLENGWTGCWAEASADWANGARRRFGPLGVEVIQSFLTSDNIVATFKAAGVPDVPDLMSIDTDGNDYWLWAAMGTAFKPRVVVVEYNASAGPHVDWAMPYNSAHSYDDTVYFGASLKAYVGLADKLGYELVGCEPSGVNAFFVRKELVDDTFERHADLRRHFVAPHYGPYYGYAAKPGV